MIQHFHLAPAFLICAISCATVSAQSQPSPATDWELTAIVLGHKLGERMKLKMDGSQVSGFVYIG